MTESTFRPNPVVTARRPPMLRSALAAATLVAMSALVGVGCGGSPVRLDAPAGPRLSPDRLGSVRSSLACDGDWMGGIPLAEDLDDDLGLAHRRGVTVIIDLRDAANRDLMPLDAAAERAGMELVEIDRALAGDTLQDLTSEISNAAVDVVRDLLNEPGRSGVLLLDDDGSLAAAVYAIYLTADRGVDESGTLNAARSSGMSDDDVAFVRRQVARIGS